MAPWLLMVPIYPLYIMYQGWEKLCLLLDYDGTLAPHGSYMSTLYNVSYWLGEAMFAPL